MLGKIIQLLGVPMEDGFRVVEGIDFDYFGNADVRFARLEMMVNPCKNKLHSSYCWSFTLLKEHDGFKDFWVNNNDLIDCKPPEDVVEEKLWVIIPHSSEIETTAKRIAGRYPEEAILEMNAGDTVKVSKAGAAPETYMAVQAGNELFLVKKTR